MLDEEEDETLINPSMAEKEQWEKNADLRKKKKGYNPYDVNEFNEFGEVPYSLYGKGFVSG